MPNSTNTFVEMCPTLIIPAALAVSLTTNFATVFPTEVPLLQDPINGIRSTTILSDPNANNYPFSLPVSFSPCTVYPVVVSHRYAYIDIMSGAGCENVCNRQKELVIL